jgi:hypothetical protein
MVEGWEVGKLKVETRLQTCNLLTFNLQPVFNPLALSFWLKVGCVIL